MDAKVGGAYGAGKAAGKRFDPIEFVQKPQVILRLICWLFALIQFSCLAAGAHTRLPGTNQKVCVLNNDGPCGFLTFIGVMAFLTTMVFLVIDALFDNWSNVRHRKYAVLADMGVSAGFVFFWFLAFCINTAAWKRTDPRPPHGGGKISTAIAFSFFSIFTWVGQTVLAYLRYKQGDETAFAPSYDSNPSGIPPAAPYPDMSGLPPTDNYQQPPFSEGGESGKTTQYQPPTY